MDTADFIAALRRDGHAFADICEAAGIDAPVPSCPGWTVADLVWHLGEVHHFWRTIVGEALTDPNGYVQCDRPASAHLLDFYRDGLAETLAVLEAADPAAPNWTWSADQTAGFVQRRMAQETAVHLVDAQLAAGRAAQIEPVLASDGIDEFLHHFFGAWPTDSPPVGGSVHLHCTDVDGEWTVRLGDGGVVVTREHAKGDAALRGAASDLLLVLWRRLPLDAAEVVGDADVAARFVGFSNLE